MLRSVFCLLLTLSISQAVAESRMPIREFLGGYSKVGSDGTPKTSRGMGLENPSTIELLSLAYGTMSTINQRIADTEEQLKSATGERKAELEKILRRSRTQDWLAWEAMKALVKRSMDEFDLRGFSKIPKNKLILSHTPANKNEELERDKVLKGYVLDRAKELYLGTLRFLSLRQPPVVKVKPSEKSSETLEPSDLHEEETTDFFAWLDSEPFTGRKPEAVKAFLSEESQYQVYRNEDVLPAATEIANGYKKLINVDDPNSPVWKLDLSSPDPKIKESLAKLVLGQSLLQKLPQAEMRKTVGLVTHYLHAVGAIADQFNVNTHDSYELTRGSLLMLFRLVVDLKKHANWRNEVQGLELLRKAAQYPPLKGILDVVQARRYEIYLEETATGPKLNGTADQKFRKEEFDVYHGDLVRELFGRDMSYYQWPSNRAYQGKPAEDVRMATSIPGEGRGPNFGPTAKARDMKPGRVWAELGTGVGSLLIALATSPSTPKTKAASFIQRSSVWTVATEKLYNRWAGAIEWVTRKAKDVQLSNLGDWVASTTGVTRPGAGVDYNSISHVGLIDGYHVDEYPEFDHVDFVDAFPNRMRQAWKAHGWGFSHARKGMAFAMRPSFMKSYLANFETKKKALDRDITASISKLGKDWERASDKVSAERMCQGYFTGEALTKFVGDYKAAADVFTQRRDRVRPVQQFCLKVWQRQGMDNFEATVLSKFGTDNLTNEKLEQIIDSAGQQAVQVGHAIRNQLPAGLGFGQWFDNNFDSMTKSYLYCSEYVHLTWLLGTGIEVLKPTTFRGPIKALLENTPGELLAKLTGGFETVPYGEKDDVIAPLDIYMTDYGRQVWELVLEQRRGFFGVNEE